jgi:hypothetical protein
MAAHTLPLPNQPPTPAMGGVKGPAPALLCTEMELSDCSGEAHFATAGAGAFELMGGDAELPEAEEVTLTLPAKRKRSSGRRVGASSPKALLPPGEGGSEGEPAPGDVEEEDGGAGKKFRGVWCATLGAARSEEQPSSPLWFSHAPPRAPPRPCRLDKKRNKCVTPRRRRAAGAHRAPSASPPLLF